MMKNDSFPKHCTKKYVCPRSASYGKNPLCFSRDVNVKTLALYAMWYATVNFQVELNPIKSLPLTLKQDYISPGAPAPNWNLI